MSLSIAKSEYYKDPKKPEIKPLKIKLGQVTYINSLWRDRLPGKNFIDPILADAKGLFLDSFEMDKVYEIHEFLWYGDKMGTSLEFLEKSISKCLDGEATIVFTRVSGEKVYVEIKNKTYSRKYPEVTLVDNPPGSS